MATMNFSIPDDVKAAFDRTFAGENKSAIVARLMSEAVAERERRARRMRAVEELLAIRKRARPVRSTVARSARVRGRP
jgi:hypothetical protein